MTKNQADRQQLKKYAVFALMGIAFAGCLWLIFAPSETDKAKQQQGAGFNEAIPDAAAGGIVSDKRDAYQLENMRQRQEGRMVSLDEYPPLAAAAESPQTQDTRDASTGGRPSAIENSAASYRDINRSLGTFYQSPGTDEDEREQEILALEWRLQELEKKLEEKDRRQTAMDEQVALMEKSYELAARYMPQAGMGESLQYPDQAGMVENQSGGLSAQEMKNKIVRSSSGNNNAKAKVSAIRQVRDQTVSALSQEYSTGELVSLYGRERNSGFNTLHRDNPEAERNTVKACIHGDQTVMAGQSVFVRLLEPILVEDAVVPAHTVLTARAALQGERLDLEISSIEHAGNIYPVKVSIYDTDGTKGVYVPASMELDALGEVAANMGNTMGSSFTMTQGAGAQIASDLTKGLIQGGSQYFAKKVKMVKINLKAGHKLMLYPEKQ